MPGERCVTLTEITREEDKVHFPSNWIVKTNAGDEITLRDDHMTMFELAQHGTYSEKGTTSKINTHAVVADDALGKTKLLAVRHANKSKKYLFAGRVSTSRLRPGMILVERWQKDKYRQRTITKVDEMPKKQLGYMVTFDDGSQQRHEGKHLVIVNTEPEHNHALHPAQGIFDNEIVEIISVRRDGHPINLQATIGPETEITLYQEDINTIARAGHDTSTWNTPQPAPLKRPVTALMADRDGKRRLLEVKRPYADKWLKVKGRAQKFAK